MAKGLGLLDTRLVGRVPSRFLTAIYAAASDLPASDPCYTPGLTAATERSSARTATERARDGASRAGPAA